MIDVRLGQVRSRVAGILCGVVIASAAAGAATIAVNDPGDGSAPGDGACTLREAVDNANLPGGGDASGGDCDPGAPGSDTIRIPGFSVVLSLGGPGDDANLGGDLDVLDSARIVGMGAAATEIVSSVGDRVLDVRAGLAGGPLDVQIVGLSLLGGSAAGGAEGGGLRVGPSATVLVDESSIRDCEAEGGGGVANNGTLILRNSELVGNRAISGTNGGGLLNHRLAEMSSVVLRTNHAEGLGGGIANESEAVLIECELLQNSADLDGGGLFNADTARSERTNYIANAVNGSGGGIRHDGASLEIAIGTFDQNFATAGGGALAASRDWQGEGLLFFGNRTPGIGGAILHDGGSATLVDSALSQNSADQDGGGIHNRSAMLVGEVVLRHNLAVDRGGAIFNDVATDCRLEGVAVDENAASGDAGGIYNSGELRANESAITRNLAGGAGGGVMSDSGSYLALRNTTVSLNRAQDDGGGLMLLGSHLLEFATLARNESVGGTGGGLWLGGAAEMINSIVAGNIGDDCAPGSALVSLGYNLDSDSSCGLAALGDLSGIAPNLGSLQPNGGPTETHALVPPSAAIDSAEPDCLDAAGLPVSIDQRRFARPEDGDGNGSQVCDRGAYERVAPAAVPRPVPDGVIGAPLLVGKLDPLGIDLELTWDVALCPSPGYHAISGPLSNVPSYVVTGGACGLSLTGSDHWNPSPGGSSWFLVLADDTGGTEGSWGLSSLGVRNGATVSGQCGTFLRDNLPTCP